MRAGGPRWAPPSARRAASLMSVPSKPPIQNGLRSAGRPTPCSLFYRVHAGRAHRQSSTTPYESGWSRGPPMARRPAQPTNQVAAYDKRGGDSGPLILNWTPRNGLQLHPLGYGILAMAPALSVWLPCYYPARPGLLFRLFTRVQSPPAPPAGGRLVGLLRKFSNGERMQQPQGDAPASRARAGGVDSPTISSAGAHRLLLIPSRSPKRPNQVKIPRWRLALGS